MKIALVYSDDFSLWVFRRGLIKTLVERGCKVYLLSKYGRYVPLLIQLGAQHIAIELERFINPAKDLYLLIKLYKIFRDEKFDIVHNFTVKPNIYGSIAAKLAGVKRVIISVTGLGILSYKENSSGAMLCKMNVMAFLVKGFYVIACYLCDKVSFQNNDDKCFFIKNKILIDGLKSVVIKGSGIDTKFYSPDAVDNHKLETLKGIISYEPNDIYVVMVSRALWNKGVKEFVEAGSILASRYDNVRFLLVGGIEKDNPFSVPESYIRDKTNKYFRWVDFIDDVRELLHLADIAVLPSYYGEGIPRNLLEAMAMRKPIITTDNVGCREVVEEGKNGYIVPVRNAEALALAIEKLVTNEEKRILFGYYSRQKAEAEFGEERVLKETLRFMYDKLE